MEFKVKKMTLKFVASLLIFFPTFVFASDPLHGTTWKTIDDKTNKPTAIVKFNEDKNGKLNASIQKLLVATEESNCVNCTGQLQNKPLIGLMIVQNLQKARNNEYDHGKILDPETGKIYDFNAKLSSDGKKLIGRGYTGISLVGRNQTWYRVN